MNTRKSFFILFSCTVFGIGTIALLDLLSVQANKHPNGFFRKFPSHPFQGTHVRDITYNSFYICGIYGRHIYLGNQRSPLFILSVDTTTKDTSRIFLRDHTGRKFTQARLSMDSSFYYVSDGALGIILSTPVHGNDTLSTILSNTRFLDVLPISPDRFSMRLLNTSRQSMLGLLGPALAQPKFFDQLHKTGDQAIFASDGMLRVNQRTKQIVFAYYYRNAFMIFDKNLDLQIQGKTIDTVQTALVRSGNLPSEKSIVLSAPPLQVNKNSTVSEKYLFIHSALIADNEQPGIFRESSVVDVYALKTGAYKFSFHLYDHAGKKMRDFAVMGTKLVALHDHYMIVYDLNPRLFN